MELVRDAYSSKELSDLLQFLENAGAFHFPQTKQGVFSAAHVDGTEQDYTGYANAWVRDNVHVAHALWQTGKVEEAVQAARGLLNHFQRQLPKARTIINGKADLNDVMQRPHIRFCGNTLNDLPEKWAHAQNDALGYFLWLVSEFALAGDLELSDRDRETVTTIAQFLHTIRYWEDEDSGHWEETRKIAASSIGAAIAGLRSLTSLVLSQADAWSITPEELEDSIAAGEKALRSILPSECVQADPTKNRRYDSALLFLIYPLHVIDRDSADQIISDVKSQLLGPYGIRRYNGDSYWCADYKESLAPESRTVDFSDDLSGRDKLLKPGMEAQWCIFDPILSVVYGERFLVSGKDEDRNLQLHHFQRSLNQLTKIGGTFPPYRCPESYYCEKEKWVPNDVVPLLWTQANLLLAFKQMQLTAAYKDR